MPPTLAVPFEVLSSRLRTVDRPVLLLGTGRSTELHPRSGRIPPGLEPDTNLELVLTLRYAPLRIPAVTLPEAPLYMGFLATLRHETIVRRDNWGKCGRRTSVDRTAGAPVG